MSLTCRAETSRLNSTVRYKKHRQPPSARPPHILTTITNQYYLNTVLLTGNFLNLSECEPSPSSRSSPPSSPSASRHQLPPSPRNAPPSRRKMDLLRFSSAAKRSSSIPASRHMTGYVIRSRQ
ncbi:hypothetical protein BJ508DRAFT_367364 [Ascobolus immersus RN42]|uniref:Uncharacterized protein n=1 Tax=Ascobolus immersus RN42 TaxID=1160509 RepID=A0A3N4HJ75_ASCIM|nr:hypothetical protein BJ508DRAFT_367364 [Ascobolus immersus RN42]